MLLAAALAAGLRLPAGLDRVLAGPTLRNAHVGALVVSAADGGTLYAHGADDTIQPASTMKLLVGSVGARAARAAITASRRRSIARGDGETR